MQKGQFFLGLDIGGTKMEGALVEIDTKTKSIECLIRKRVPTHREEGLKAVLKNLLTLIQDLLQETKISELRGLGVGLPGSVHPKTLKMLRGNTNFFSQQNIFEFLLPKIPQLQHKSCILSAGNDANCFALAECFLGVGKHFPIPSQEQIAIGIILGTGLGGGLIYNGEIFTGRNGGGMEIGHIPLFEEDDRSCYCPSSGCSELFLSGHGLEGEFHENSHTLLEKASFQEIYRSRLKKELLCLTNIFDPDYFVLGGGVSNVNEIYLGLEEHLKEHSFIPISSPKVYKNSLGDSAGVFGAALLCLEKKSLDFERILL